MEKDRAFQISTALNTTLFLSFVSELHYPELYTNSLYGGGVADSFFVMLQPADRRLRCVAEGNKLRPKRVINRERERKHGDSLRNLLSNISQRQS